MCLFVAFLLFFFIKNNVGFSVSIDMTLVPLGFVSTGLKPELMWIDVFFVSEIIFS